MLAGGYHDAWFHVWTSMLGVLAALGALEAVSLVRDWWEARGRSHDVWWRRWRG